MGEPECFDPNTGNKLHAINCQSVRATKYLLFITLPLPLPKHTFYKHKLSWEK